MCTVGTAQVPLLDGQDVFDRRESNDLFEKVPPCIALGGVWEVRHRSVAARLFQLGLCNVVERFVKKGSHTAMR